MWPNLSFLPSKSYLSNKTEFCYPPQRSRAQILDSRTLVSDSTKKKEIFINRQGQAKMVRIADCDCPSPTKIKVAVSAQEDGPVLDEDRKETSRFRRTMNRATRSIFSESKIPPGNKSSVQTQGNSEKDCLFLEKLPTDIILLVLDLLDDVSKVCLSNTNRYFHEHINVNRDDLSTCQEWLITCRLESDMSEYPGKLACAHCKKKRDRADFSSGTGWRNWFLGQKTESKAKIPRYLSCHPTLRLCWKHDGALATLPASVHEDNLIRRILPYTKVPWGTAWFTFRVLRCLHCYRPVDSVETRDTGCSECECDVCPTAWDLHFWRSKPLANFGEMDMHISQSLGGFSRHAIERDSK